MKRSAEMTVLLLLVFSLMAGCGEPAPVQGAPAPPQLPVTSTSALCNVQYHYDNVVNEGESQVVVDHEQDYNGTSDYSDVTLTAEKSGTVEVSAEYKLTQKLGVSLEDVITASVEEELGVSLTISVTTSIGNGYTYHLGPHKFIYGNYGVFVQIASGHLYSTNPQCLSDESDWGTVLVYVPMGAGWCVWTSDNPPCSTVTLP